MIIGDRVKVIGNSFPDITGSQLLGHLGVIDEIDKDPELNHIVNVDGVGPTPFNVEELEVVCHCGRPMYTDEFGFTRGMCEPCSTVRCDTVDFDNDRMVLCPELEVIPSDSNPEAETKTA